MLLVDRKHVMPAAMLALLLFVAILSGCGLRQSQTGSLSSRLLDADGNAVAGAEVYSIFAEREKVFSGLDGGFYLSELPAGLNNIVITHPDFTLEERQVEISADNATVIDFIKLDRANAPYRITDIAVSVTGSSTAVITWNTYRSVVCQLEYGKTTGYGSVYRENRATTEHSATLSGLSPETLYHFRVWYVDDADVTHYSIDTLFKTGVADRPEKVAAVGLQPFSSLNVVTVEWQAATSGQKPAGYNVYRREKRGEWFKLNDGLLTGTFASFSDKTAVAGTFCQYAVTAVNGFAAESEMVESEMVFIPGVINQSLVISADDSPVKLSSDLIVAAGAHLSVEPGVEFLVSETDAFASGYDESRVEIIVHGRIAVKGSAVAPVVFAPLDGSGRRDHWAGIRILSSYTGVSEISHAQLFGCSGFALEISADRARVNNLSIAYSQHGLLLEGVRETLELDSCSFSEIASVALDVRESRHVIVGNTSFNKVYTAVSASSATADDQIIMRNCDIDCLKAGFKGTYGRIKLKNILIVSPDGTAIHVVKAINNSENYIDHCTLDSLNGIVVDSGKLAIENNIVVNRYKTGIAGITDNSALSPEYSYNDIYGFATVFDGCNAGVGALSVDPDFVGGNPYDYHLKALSPAKKGDQYGVELGRYGASRF